eukprot:1932858-Amphidinium_carterae.1
MPCFDKLCGGMEFVCWGCAKLQRSRARNRMPKGRSDTQPTGTIEPREGHQVRRSRDRGHGFA